MRKLIPLVAVFALLGAPRPAASQIHVEARGDVGFNRVNVADWIAVGVFDAKKLVGGADVAVVMGRRGPQALQVVAEVGYQHLLTYKRIASGQPTTESESAVRLYGAVRFWLRDGSFYGEFGAGMYAHEGLDDPTAGVAFGKLFDIGERISIPVRVRANILFDPNSFVIPIYVQAGLSYRLRG